ncbi:MAG: 16S rRNA (cytosine(967)-C(5))-methyltransferase RsmB [Burkholderiales bacterium]|nr:16S rRNA (cytosine(967)-C(5))-methyltransferase RsmB [Burkholderiales bacterium]
MTSAAKAGAGAPPLWQALLLAAEAWRALRAGTALDRALESAQLTEPAHPRAAAAAKDIAYTATRHLALIDWIVARLVPRVPAPAVEALLGVALGQLVAARHPPYAVVDQAVEAAKRTELLKGAAGFINGVLRNALRQRDALRAEGEADERVRFNLPGWWLQRLQRTYPEQWASIADVQRHPPPLVLRVETTRVSVEDYIARCAAAGVQAQRVGMAAVCIEPPRPVDSVPGFAEGLVAVQDAGAQLAAHWLGVADGMRVLDACAAPGGKTAQLARAARIDLLAVDADALRLRRVEDNLARLHAREFSTVHVHAADAAVPEQLQAIAGNHPYDRVLLDAPCTASGIVRRHPDIPWLRRPADVAQLATQQRRLLEALWPLVAPAGRLLYVVCSVFPEEGARQVAAFLAQRRDARLRALPAASAGGLTAQLVPSDRGAVADISILPSMHDGFFFALFEKH